LPANTPCEGRKIDPSGYDAGKKIKGKKRHILVDTQGLLMCAIVHAADWECLNRSALAFLRWASIRLMVRKLCQKMV
jgi:hypothetical protein